MVMVVSSAVIVADVSVAATREGVMGGLSVALDVAVMSLVALVVVAMAVVAAVVRVVSSPPATPRLSSGLAAPGLVPVPISRRCDGATSTTFVI